MTSTKDELPECDCVCKGCNSKHGEGWVGCEDCDCDLCRVCGKMHKRSEDESEEETLNALT